MPAGGGRPTKLNDKTHRQIVRYVRQGKSREAAAYLARIHPSTIYVWIKRGHKAATSKRKPSKRDAIYVKFFEDIRHAETLWEYEQVEAIQKMCQRWQGPAWLLRSKWPKRWGRRMVPMAGASPVPQQASEQVIDTDGDFEIVLRPKQRPPLAAHAGEMLPDPIALMRDDEDDGG